MDIIEQIADYVIDAHVELLQENERLRALLMSIAQASANVDENDCPHDTLREIHAAALQAKEE